MKSLYHLPRGSSQIQFSSQLGGLPILLVQNTQTLHLFQCISFFTMEYSHWGGEPVPENSLSGVLSNHMILFSIFILQNLK